MQIGFGCFYQGMPKVVESLRPYSGCGLLTPATSLPLPISTANIAAVVAFEMPVLTTAATDNPCSCVRRYNHCHSFILYQALPPLALLLFLLLREYCYTCWPSEAQHVPSYKD
jgi:hypothetical protein